MAFSLDKQKNKVNDIKKNIEIKKSQLQDLEKAKQETHEMGMDIQATNLDEKTKKVAMEGINAEYETISEKGEKTAEEMNADTADIESIKQETQKEMETSELERKKLEGKKAVLEKFGLGKGIEKAIDEISDHQKALEEFGTTITEIEKEIDNIHKKCNML